MEKKETKLTVDAVKEIAAEAVKGLKTEMEAKKAEKKAVAPKKVVEVSEEEKSVGFLKALVDGDKKKMAEFGKKDVTTASISIPQAWSNTIDRALEEGSVARQEAKVMPMATKVLNLPKTATDGTVAWISEAGSITESTPTFGVTTLTEKKLAGYVEISPETVDNANADIIANIMEGVALNMGQEETNQWLNGTGSSPSITGVLADTDVTDVDMAATKTSFADVTGDNLVDLVKAVPVQRRAGAKFVMSDYVFGLVQKLKDSSNRPLYQALTEAERGRLLGYEVVITNEAPELADDAVSTPFIAFGNFEKGTVIGDRKAMTAKISEDFRFQNVLLALRVIERLDIAVHLPGYLARLTTAAS